MKTTPALSAFDPKNWKDVKTRHLILGLGFEPRATTSIERLTCSDASSISGVTVIRYLPRRKSRFRRIFGEIRRLGLNDRTKIVRYDFWRPAEFEVEFVDFVTGLEGSESEIVIDISAMSKMLIVIMVNVLIVKRISFRILYSEARFYAPTQTDYLSWKFPTPGAVKLPYYGVGAVVRTPMTTSIRVQDFPNAVVMFLSFNEALVRAIEGSISAAEIYLVGSIVPREKWREAAMVSLHRGILDEHRDVNSISEDGLPVIRSSTLDYRETIDVLVKLYTEFYLGRRMVISPTGSKMQAVGVAIFCASQSDVHIEYPCPEGYRILDFSSEEIEAVHELYIESPESLVAEVRNITSEMLFG